MSERFTPGPWEWWTSNSWRRLSSEHRDHPREGAVLCPHVSRSDGHPDVSISEADMALIAAAPDLYAALKPFAEIVEMMQPDPELPDETLAYATLGDFRRAHNALARARGEPAHGR
jgi:hypothetical protein